MAKDSQIDKKQVRKRKAKGSNTTLASDAQNNSRNAKKQSIENNDV